MSFIMAPIWFFVWCLRSWKRMVVVAILFWIFLANYNPKG
jgi:hypothetical protein